MILLAKSHLHCLLLRTKNNKKWVFQTSTVDSRRQKMMLTVRFELTPLARPQLECGALDQLGQISSWFVTMVNWFCGADLSESGHWTWSQLKACSWTEAETSRSTLYFIWHIFDSRIQFWNKSNFLTFKSFGYIILYTFYRLDTIYINIIPTHHHFKL